MFELNRIRLHNIGPDRARYGDVILDLSGGGAPVQSAALFPHPLDVTRRPSPATLLVLINGGGKSVLIRMITSTVLPRHQSDRGRQALKDYLVSPAAPSHVALEWADARTGRLLVTGQVLSPVPGSTPNRLFYSFRPSPDLELERLPLTDGRRRLSLEEVRDSLVRANQEAKGLEVHPETGQDAWEQHLRELGLEPDLFAVQDAMNHSEGNAADVFRQASGRHFVQWLLARCLDGDRYTDFVGSFEAYADNIRRHDQMRVERVFCQRLERTCTSLGGLHRDLTAAAEEHSRGRARIGALTGSVRAARDLAGAERDDLTQQASTAGGEAQRLQQVAQTAGLRHKEITRLMRALERDAAEEKVARLASALAVAGSAASAWDVVPALLRELAAIERYRQLEILIGKAEQAARPAREARDSSGAAYRQALDLAAAAALEAVRTLDEDRAQAAREARELDQQAGERERSAGTAEGVISELAKTVSEAGRATTRARAEGLLGLAEAPAEAAERLGREATGATGRASRLESRRDTSAADAEKLRAAAEALEEPAAWGRKAADTAGSHAGQQRAKAAGILSDPLASALLELDDPGDDQDALAALDQYADDLLARTAEARNAAANRMAAVGSLIQDSQRILEALAAPGGGLLPPRRETQDIITILAENGVDAHTGWRWLEQNVHPDRHAETIRSLPHLTDGAVVATGADLNRAQEILAAQRPLPKAAVAVGLGDLLHDPAGTAAGFFTVEPTPALHDPDAAAAERQRAESQLAGLQHDEEQLRERRDGMTRLHERTRMWREENPAGSTVPLLEELRSLLQAADDAESVLVQARTAAREAREAASRDTKAAQQARDTANTLQAAAASALALAETERTAASARNRITELTGEAEEHREIAGTLRGDAAAIRAANEQRAAAAEGHRRDAAGFTTTKANVIAGTAEPLRPGEASLADLKIRYEEADASLRAVEVGEDLRQRATEAEQALQNAAADLTDADPQVRHHAERLIKENPATGDPAARDAAARQARNIRDDLASQHGDAKAALGAAGNALTHASPPGGGTWADLEDAWVPATTEQGMDLARQADRAARDARQRATSAGEAQASLTRQATAAGTRHDQFDKVLAFLDGDTDPEPEPDVPEPYPGTTEDADDEAHAARDSLRGARNRHETLRGQCRDIAHDIRKIASDPEFDSLSAPIKKQVAALDPDLLPPLAGEWAWQLASRIASLATDLEDADRHRGMLAVQLKEYTTEALKVLRKAERLSVLPASAGPWKDQQVLKIRFAMPDPNVLAARAGDVIDREAREQKQKRTTGLDLVLRCVSESVPRDFAVSILKPDQAGPVGHIPVERMREVFSEGQELTGAIMLYCTLAAIRIDSRGHAQGRHGGMLILDNPIGKASAGYLLTLQMSLAEATGVQLIYTTGVEDDRVQATFPLRIRLRNSTDRRSGDRYLHVTGRTIAVPGDGNGTGAISAIRLMDRAGT